MVSMTKDQLKALPAFKYASDTSKPLGSAVCPRKPAGSPGGASLRWARTGRDAGC